MYKKTDECWSVISGYDDYMVSNTGIVISRKRGDWVKLKPGTNSRGYLCVSLEGRSKCVHRLVAEAFIPNENGMREINHIDGNKLNNNANNLEWCTRSHNIKHSYDIGLRDSMGSIKKCGQPIMIIETGEIFYSISECARYLGVSLEQVRCCLDEKKTQHHSCKGYHFKRIGEVV